MKQFNPKLNLDISAKFTLIVILLLLLYPILFGFPFKIIGADTLGYYLYLPQTFIEGDLAMSSTDAATSALIKYHNTNILYQVHLVEDTGNHVIQYSSGMAFIYMPFFLIAHAFASIFGYTTDGYSLPYSWSLIIASYTMTIVGLVYLRLFLLKLFNPSITAITVVLIAFGTNYFITQSQSPGLPHIHLFAFYAALIYYTIRWHESNKLKHAVLIGILLGWMILIRPTEIIAILIPILWGIHNKATLKNKLILLKNNIKHVLIITIIIISILFVQCLYWYHVTGHFIFNSYMNNGEGLHLEYPHTIDFLFSYRKGWFIYTPLMILPFIGVFTKGDFKNSWITPFLVVTIIAIYVSSSWSVWWYAGSFSQRTMVQTYPLFAIGLASFLVMISKSLKRKIIFVPVIILVTLLNLFQSWQYIQYILPPDRITKDFYWAIFGKTEAPLHVGRLLSVNREEEVFDRNKLEAFWTDKARDEEGNIIIDQHLTADNEWGKGIETPYRETCKSEYCWYEITFEAFIPEHSDPFQIELVADMAYNNKHYGYVSYVLGENENFKTEQWCHYTYHYISPHPRTPTVWFRTFVWGKKHEIFIRNFSVTSFIEKESQNLN
ncbi:glycosyltransferase family 39 protein [Paracrocinitomix mangrovi]|uniref:glycosyltransferase family 39 protein n=1 Tax=Paracrocinitomix mangrovi TaxID=2862509 RepID=UPI001C8E5519|nr:glycosyltransferase family 39 protein [Paracrocinitomix mangrovi]UKN03640.1 glycosyltransferase family 39 protein [Paracrocinitomix mangrovi]